MDFKNKKILVLGAGISGISVTAILQKLGAKVTLSDNRTKENIDRDLSGLETLGVVLALGKQDESLLTDTDLIVLSPGISVYLPLVESAQTRGIQVISEIEVAYQICKSPLVAVTGTNGKTTTTTLVGEMVKTAYQDVVVGGNIGQALSHEVAGVDESGIVVAEISSFQLEAILNFRPRIAAILNITADHLDRHGTMATYIKMKEKIFANQTANDFLILNYDDDIVRDMAKRTKSKVVFFSRKSLLTSGIFVQEGIIKIAWEGQVFSICPTDEIQVRGAHNIENAMAACGVAFFAGVDIEYMAQVLRGFNGVEHRIEPVATIDGVQYYNDSKATNPESAIKALDAFPGNVILIAGGRDKKTDLTEFMTVVREKVCHLILIGEASGRFHESAVRHGVKSIRIESDLESAVKLAHQLAEGKDVVLLSPACSSYDMFKNYEERGRAFKRFVQHLE